MTTASKARSLVRLLKETEAVQSRQMRNRHLFVALKRQTKMKVLVAYMSKTGNTRRVAQAIYQEIECEKEIKRVKVKDLEGYDLAFLGFPIHGYGPDRKARRFLERQTKDQQTSLFITHASPEDQAELAGYLAKFRDAVAGAILVGVFNCQGELAKGVKLVSPYILIPRYVPGPRSMIAKGSLMPRDSRERVFSQET